MNTQSIADRNLMNILPSYESLFLSFLAPMKLGKLEVNLPSGRTVCFGSNGPVIDDQCASIQVRSDRFFKRCILFGDIGFGESYTDGDWDTPDLTKVIRWMILNRDSNPGMSGSKVSKLGIGLLKGLNRIQHFRKDNDLSGSVKNISAHYDLGNQFFETFLDSTLLYSSADFSSGAKTLEEAQIAKIDRLARSVQVKPGDHVLEIGGGWGAFAIHLAQKYGANVTTITVSKEQFKKINERVQAAGLTDRIEVKFQDYRHVEGKFDKIVSVEMLEAVGHKHLKSFFAVAERVLKPEGIMGVQVITSADSRYDELRKGVDWIQKHIFPGSLIPSIAALTEACRQNSSLQMHSLFDMGRSYAKTLNTWGKNFNQNRSQIEKQGFDEQFIRAWNYYLCYCEAAFYERHISVVQITYTRPNNVSILS